MLGLEVSGNQLTNLIGCPEYINGPLLADNNILQSLIGCPRNINSDFSVFGNISLSTLEGGPSHVGGDFDVGNTAISNLVGTPSYIGGSLDVTSCFNLKSLKGIHQHIKKMYGRIYIGQTDIQSDILGIFMIAGCKGLSYTGSSVPLSKVANIVNCHITRGRSGAISCIQELISEGLSEYANM
jgi:hypothetical protein